MFLLVPFEKSNINVVVRCLRPKNLSLKAILTLTFQFSVKNATWSIVRSNSFDIRQYLVWSTNTRLEVDQFILILWLAFLESINLRIFFREAPFCFRHCEILVWDYPLQHPTSLLINNPQLLQCYSCSISFAPSFPFYSISLQNLVESSYTSNVWWCLIAVILRVQNEQFSEEKRFILRDAEKEV